MTLPQAPTGRSRRLIQTIWEIAGETEHWPTFSSLDRRLDSQYDMQALEVLREIPLGFLYGVRPNSPMPPADSQEIGLTVAGVAGCQNTSEILSVFVEFMQIATRMEEDWQPPADEPNAQPVLTDTEFAARARTLPAHRRGHVLRLLFLILQSEHIGLAGYAAGRDAGHWSVTFTREIRAFRDINDINDYWSRRFNTRENWRAAAAASPVIASPDHPAVSYIFNAPVSGTNVAVGGSATQRANDPETAGTSGRDSDAVDAARLGGKYAIAAAVLAAIITVTVPAVLTNGFGLTSSSTPSAGPTPSASTHRPTSGQSPSSADAIEQRYDGKDPVGKDGPLSKCADPPASQPVSQVHPAVLGPDGSVVGHIELRTSPICPVIWARVDWLHRSYLMPPGWSLYILMHRRIHPKTIRYVSHDTSNYVYGNMLVTISGCVYAEVYFADGSHRTPSAITQCFQ
jgi:hypothetical protein